jgi:hypothetical protein
MYAPRGVYQVTAELPVRAGEFEYRIKHPREQCERVAAESDLAGWSHGMRRSLDAS